MRSSFTQTQKGYGWRADRLSLASKLKSVVTHTWRNTPLWFCRCRGAFAAKESGAAHDSPLHKGLCRLYHQSGNGGWGGSPWIAIGVTFFAIYMMTIQITIGRSMRLIHKSHLHPVRDGPVVSLQTSISRGDMYSGSCSRFHIRSLADMSQQHTRSSWLSFLFFFFFFFIIREKSTAFRESTSTATPRAQTHSFVTCSVQKAWN